MGTKLMRNRLVWWISSALLVPALAVGGGYLFFRADLSPKASAEQEQEDEQQTTPQSLRVTIAHPQVTEMDRTSLQPGSVHAFQSVDLFAGASGFLKTLNVDIGDQIKKGQELAIVDVPDLAKQVQRNASMVEQERAKVAQMKARAASARADWEAAKASVPRAEAMLRSKQAELRYRQLQLDRMRQLALKKVIEDKLVDEATSHRDAVREGEIAAQEAVTTAKANVDAMAAKIQAADADVNEADAERRVAQAELEKSQVLANFAIVHAPFDGVVTRRNYFPGDYVRAATEGGDHLPVLTVQRTDLMRVVVEVPDRDVPYCDVGDTAIIEVDALPGVKLPPAKVSRIARSEDADTRLMHVEIDVPNPTGKICNGMFGHATIILERTKVLQIPSSCLVGKAQDGKGSVYVVRNGEAHLVPVMIGSDNGVHSTIISGITERDEVIQRPSGDISDGAVVSTSVDSHKE